MLGADFSREIYEIETEEQASILFNVAGRRYFEPFLGRENNIASASREVGCSVETMTYRVKKFLASGFLAVTRMETRQGRAIKYYRSVADVFFLPLSIMPYADVEEMLEVQSRIWVESLVHGIAGALSQENDLGQYLYRDLNGEVWFSGSSPSKKSDDSYESVVFDSFGELFLTNEEAMALRKALIDVLLLYSSKSIPSRDNIKRFGYGILFTPLEP